MPRMEDLEDILPDFNDWPGLHDRKFEEEFLRPRLEVRGWNRFIHFSGGREFTGGEFGPSYRNRTVRVANATTIKSYKYGR